MRAEKLTLPSRDEFTKLVQTMDKTGGRDAHNCADLMRFLAFTRCRRGEASKVMWADVDFGKCRIAVRSDAETGTKHREVRRVPMIDACRTLFKDHVPSAQTRQSPRRSWRCECQREIDRASKLTGVMRISNHDFCHLLATRCIESGVDMPTVSRWLGHKDGGALAMKTYGHLRDEHSEDGKARTLLTNTSKGKKRYFRS